MARTPLPPTTDQVLEGIPNQFTLGWRRWFQALQTVTGVPGPPGAQGPPGHIGPPGPSGAGSDPLAFLATGLLDAGTIAQLEAGPGILLSPNPITQYGVISAPPVVLLDTEGAEEGTIGPIGPIGPAGPPGIMGPLGLDGEEGAEGIPGPPGATGPVGLQGIAGVGFDGDEGAEGPIGPPGLAGVAGATGPAGPQGLQGVPGFDGEDAPEGPMWPPWPASTLRTLFTPTVTFATPGDLSVAYTTQQGAYVREGPIILFWYNLVFTPTYTTAAGQFQISVPPIPLADLTWAWPVRLASPSAWPAGTTQLAARPQGSVLVINATGSSGATAAFSTTQIASGTAYTIIFSGFYF